ncbi:hypothetical protein B5E41_10000 [Rhizobium esperanzae]|uniref:Uncharacterized protein n=1 Tax=Rhizobium esperanzae TaxID=1967781 RepID=A0A246E0W4_9HYPH|nr:hypothetical protein B5E41_10000 [Rhizobium esperanzae]
MVDIVLSSRFGARPGHGFYIAHDCLLNNRNFTMPAMQKNCFQLFIARYKFAHFRSAPCWIS